jgi:hypothetical protein
MPNIKNPKRINNPYKKALTPPTNKPRANVLQKVTKTAATIKPSTKTIQHRTITKVNPTKKSIV